jgi:hypothetical protein
MSIINLFSSDLVLADIVWRPGYGARWIWAIALAQLIAAFLCLSAGKQELIPSDEGQQRRRSKFWSALSGLMFLLCLNKILDLQSLITIAFRQMARSENWYQNRQSLQATFVLIAVAGGVICVGLSAFVLRGRWNQRGLACFAAIFLIALVTIRMVSYHKVDRFLYGMPVIGNRMNAGMELAGSILVGLNAFLVSRKQAYSNDI